MSKRQQIRASFIAKRTQPEFWLNCGLFVCLGLALLPITIWIANTAYEQSRILHALIVLVMAIFVLVFYNRIEIDDPLMLNKSARKALYAAYGLMLFSLIFQKLLPSPLRAASSILRTLTDPGLLLRPDILSAICFW